MTETTISTIKNGVRVYLAQGRGECIGTKNFRNVFLSPESALVTVHRAEGDTIVIGIKTAHGLDGQLIPSYGIIEPNWGLVTHKDGRHPFDYENRRWKPIQVAGGWHLQYGPTLFLGLSADEKAPTLTETPVLWSIPGLESPAPSAAENISLVVEEVPRSRISELETVLFNKDADVAALKAENAALKAEVAALKAAIRCLVGA